MKKIREKCVALLSAMPITACASSLISCSDDDGGNDNGSYAWSINTDNKITGGSISCSPDLSTNTVTVYPTANPGYTLETITVTKESGEVMNVAKNSDGVYSFTAPKGEFTVSATFKENSDVAVATGTASVGDIVLSDGMRISASDALKMSPAQVGKAVAVVFYSGSSSDLLGEKTLAVGLKISDRLNWSSKYADGKENVETIRCEPSAYGKDTASTATFTGDTDGSDNWSALCDAVSDEDDADKYPAWTWANQYASNNSLPGDFASGWYMPTVAELCALYHEKSKVNESIVALGGKELKQIFWTSSQSTKENAAYFAWLVRFDNGTIGDETKSSGCNVCVVRAL